MKFTPSGDPISDLNSMLRKYRLDDLLLNISIESSSFFKSSYTSSLGFGIRYDSYTLISQNTRKVSHPSVYITGWNLIDLSYKAILATNDFRGISVPDNNHIYLLISLLTEANTKAEETRIQGFDKSSNSDMMIYVWGFFGEQRRIQHPATVFDSVVRDLYILFDIANDDKEINVNNAIIEEIGVPYNSVITALYLLWFGSTASPNVSDLEKNIIWNDSLKKDDFSKILKYYTTDYYEVRKSPLGRQILYTKPFIKTQRGQIISVNCFLNLFLYEHCILWLARNHYRNSQKFVDHFGLWFEKYFYELLCEYVEESCFEKIPEALKKRADWCIHLGNYDILLEQKSALLPLDVKQQESCISSTKAYITRNIIKAINQLDATEKALCNSKYIKIILLYEDYIEPEIIDSIFYLPECSITNDNYYWILTIDEMESLLYTYYNDITVFDSIMQNKIQLEKSHSTDGRSISKIMQMYSISENHHLKKQKFAKYSSDIIKEACALLRN